MGQTGRHSLIVSAIDVDHENMYCIGSNTAACAS